MRILHVLCSMDPATGGPPAVAARLAAGQASALGPDGAVAIFTHESPGRQTQIQQSLNGIPSIDSVALVFVELPRFGALITYAATAALRQHISNADVVHLHGVWDPIVWKAAAIARRLRVPYIITPHGMLDPWCLQQSRLKKQVALVLTTRRMLSSAASLHLLNEDESRLIEPLNLPTPRRVIPNGVFLEEIEPLPPKGSFYTLHPQLRQQPYVLFISRLHHKKGLDYLAKAFGIVAKKDANVRLVVAGPDGGEQANFERWVREENVAGRVHVVGPIYGRDKLAALRDATCFCLPSRQEGFSVAITEALGCGVPVVISENCHFPQVQEVGAGIVTPLDERAIANGLLKVLGDASLRQRMADAGRTLVRTQLTWPAIARQAIEMYRKAIAPAVLPR
jgi:glycosyltransferase involved in cell wall biosynthesis